MAKQTFTTGQVLTAAQVNALQANDFNQTVSTKTASYVLVAADKGTRIVMNSTSATTITVNTGLFDAGDTLYIHNTNSGVCTITAGTATVATSGSLVLAQNQGGVLYFTSASASIFFQYATPASGDIEGVTAGTGISGGGTSGTVTITNSMATEITAAGDIIVGTGSGTFDNLPIGTTGQILTADTTVSPYKVKWAAASSGALTLIKTQTIGSAVSSVTVTGAFSSTYDNYLITISGGTLSADANLNLQLGSTATGYYWNGYYMQPTSTSVGGDAANNTTTFKYAASGGTTSCLGMVHLFAPNLAQATGYIADSLRANGNRTFSNYRGSESSSTQHTAFTLNVDSAATATGGTIRVYGLQNS